MYFFDALEKSGMLAGAVSSKPNFLENNIVRAMNFHLNKDQWRFAYHLDPTLFRIRTQAALNRIEKLDVDFSVLLQIGAWFDFTDNEKITVSYHDGNLARRLDSPHGYPSISKHRLRKAFEYEKGLYERLDLIFTMSHWLKESFVKDFGVDEGKVIPVYAGINFPEIERFPQRAYESRNFIFVGKDFERKGGKELLRAFSRVRSSFPDATLTIIGPSLRDLPDGVINPGFVSKKSGEGLAELARYYLHSRAFVMPTRYEPFGIAFAEAMAHGLPCVGTRNCAVPELIEHNETGFLVDVGDEKGLADCMIELLESEDLCQRFGKKGFERYQRDFRWSSVTEKIVRETECIAR